MKKVERVEAIFAWFEMDVMKYTMVFAQYGDEFRYSSSSALVLKFV